MSSIVLVLVSCTTLVIGVHQSSARDVFISIGCSVVSGAVLVLSVRARKAATVYPYAGLAFSEEPPLPPAACLDLADAGGSMPSPAPSQTISPPAPPLAAPSPFHAAVGLQAPGPGSLGRLRRRPLAGSGSPRPPLTTALQDSGAGARRSDANACAAGRRPKSDSRSAPAAPAKAAAARTKARVPPGVPTKAVARKAAGANGSSGNRQVSANGTGPAKQARPEERAVRP